MIYHVAIGERTFEVELDGPRVSVEGRAVDAELVRLDGGLVRSLILDGRSYRVAADKGDGAWDLSVRGWRIQATVIDERTRRIREMTGTGPAATGPKPIVAPMPGLVVRVEVSEGEAVEAGRGIVIVEAMKMENELTARAPGVVRSVHVEEGQAVEKGQLLVDFASVAEAEA